MPPSVINSLIMYFYCFHFKQAYSITGLMELFFFHLTIKSAKTTDFHKNIKIIKFKCDLTRFSVVKFKLGCNLPSEVQKCKK